MTSIGAMSGPSAAYGVQQPYRASSAPAPADNVLSYLTADDRKLIATATGTTDDRKLIATATGTTLNAQGLDDHGRALAPISAFLIAQDRKDGTLTAGQPITGAYLQHLISTQTSGPGGDQGLIEQLNKMLDVVNRQQGNQQRTWTFGPENLPAYRLGPTVCDTAPPTVRS